MEILNQQVTRRLSKKAKHLHLRVCPGRGIELVIPINFRSEKIIELFLLQNQSWIKKYSSGNKEHIPINELLLESIDQKYSVSYQSTTSQQTRIKVIHNHLTIYGDIDDLSKNRQIISNWLKNKAKLKLLPYLKELSEFTGLDYNSATIRGQKTLWGSCNSNKNISLNYKLLFLPKQHTKHIMLHELCHTKHMNHSARFWKLLNKFDPDYKKHNAEIKKADIYIPYGI